MFVGFHVVANFVAIKSDFRQNITENQWKGEQTLYSLDKVLIRIDDDNDNDVDKWMNKQRLSIKKNGWRRKKAGRGGERERENKAKNIPLRFIAICLMYTLTSY